MSRIKFDYSEVLGKFVAPHESGIHATKRLQLIDGP